MVQGGLLAEAILVPPVDVDLRESRSPAHVSPPTSPWLPGVFAVLVPPFLPRARPASSPDRVPLLRRPQRQAANEHPNGVRNRDRSQRLSQTSQSSPCKVVCTVTAALTKAIFNLQLLNANFRAPSAETTRFAAPSVSGVKKHTDATFRDGMVRPSSVEHGSGGEHFTRPPATRDGGHHPGPFTACDESWRVLPSVGRTTAKSCAQACGRNAAKLSLSTAASNKMRRC